MAIRSPKSRLRHRKPSLWVIAVVLGFVVAAWSIYGRWHVSAGTVVSNVVPVEGAAAALPLARVISAAGNSGEVRLALAELMEQAWKLSADELGSEVRAYFATGQDVSTGLSFDIGTDGSIDQPSSLRVALLDLLVRLAPDQAVVMGRELLPKAKNGDEWAAALKAASLLPEPNPDRAFLVAEVRRRLTQRDWLDNPTAGFLAAFDAVPHFADEGLCGELARIYVSPQSAASTHTAAELALSETAQLHAAWFVGFMLEHTDFLAEVPAMRGTLLASADVREEAARSRLVAYFGKAGASEEEFAAFLEKFPQTTWTSGVRLFTGGLTPGLAAAEKPSQYAAAVAVIDGLRTLPIAAKQTYQTRLQSMRSTVQRRLAQSQVGLSPP